MKKNVFIWLLLITVAAAGAAAPARIKNYTHSFFGVYGRRASVMGKVDGSAAEVWIYPYKVVHGLDFRVVVEGSPEEPFRRIGSYAFSPAAFSRELVGEKWKITETVYPHGEEPLVFWVYRVHALTDITLEFYFKPDLAPMWPAAVGGKYSYWAREGYFVMSESSGRHHAFFGGFRGEKIGRLPAHKLPGGRLRFRIPLKRGIHHIPLMAAAGQGDFKEIRQRFTAARETWESALRHREQRWRAYEKDHLRVTTPDAALNEALFWAVMNLEAAFVRNPGLGEGLIAGYGLSYEGERPGFGWYFGGDGLINALALLNIGDFTGARREIEFLLKYQRQDGKIMHELSQGAGLVDWFGDYGFPFFHGDTTLYFAACLDFYVNRSGDTGLLRQYRDRVDRVFDWMDRCDADGDGVVETGLAGAGASETGPLRQKMKTDIYLAALSARAWQAMAAVYRRLDRRKKAAAADRRAAAAGESLERLFWDPDQRYYMYAVKGDSSRIPEITIWPAVGLRFGVMDRERGGLAVHRIASPELSADWGTRYLSSRSGYYDPSSYNNGAVWPFLTGFSSLALYRYGNPYHAFSLLQANLHIIGDFDYGAPTELLSGDIYRPLDQSVPNQIWSSGNTLSALVEGLLGFAADAPARTIRLRPHIPLHWDHLEVSNLKAGGGRLHFKMNRQENRLVFRFDFEDLDGFTFTFDPRIPARHLKVAVDGAAVDRLAPVRIAASRRALTVGLDLEDYVYPLVRHHPGYGEPSSAPIIRDFRLEEEGFVIDLWARGTVALYFVAHRPFRVPAGTLEKEGALYKWTLTASPAWTLRTFTCPFN